jgi:hypothetical protein
MTKQETLEFNKNCAQYLGKVYKDNYIIIHYNNKCGVNPSGATWEECKYHSDSNWLMEIKDAVCKSHHVHEFSTHYDSSSRGYYCKILPKHMNAFDHITTQVFFQEKEAVAEAINKFLIWEKNA